MRDRVGLSYSYSRTKSEYINQPQSFDGWDQSQNVGLTFLVVERPAITYTFGFSQETEQGVAQSWEPTHSFGISDVRMITKTLKLSLDATYGIEETTEANDISLVYSMGLDHTISRTATETLTLTKEPVRTFGSTSDTDSTGVQYSFRKNDLFIYHLNLDATVGFTRDKPLGAPSSAIEETWTYTAGLTYARQLSRKWARDISYLYSHESSNLYDEPIDEQRVTLTYVYTY
jgi:hypothetical protein